MKTYRIKPVIKALPRQDQIPFVFPETQPTESTHIPTENSSFFRELKKSSPPYKAILDKNPMKKLPIPQNNGLPFRRRARSNSPERCCLSIAQAKRSLFPRHKPVAATKRLEDSFAGQIYKRVEFEVEEDEDLKKIKEMAIAFAIIAVPVGLILLQGDAGSAIVFSIFI